MNKTTQYISCIFLCFLFSSTRAQNYKYNTASGADAEGAKYNSNGVFKCNIDTLKRKVTITHQFSGNQPNSETIPYKNKRDTVINHEKYLVLNVHSKDNELSQSGDMLLVISKGQLMIYDITFPKSPYLAQIFSNTLQQKITNGPKQQNNSNTESVSELEKYIIKGEKPSNANIQTKYENDIRFIVATVPKIKSYQYSNEVFDALGYELINSDYSDKIAYRNCSKNIMVDIGEYQGQLSITMTWVSEKIRNQTKLMFCKSGLTPEEDFKEAQKIWKQEDDLKKQQSNQETAYTVVEEMPTFPGGRDELNKYIEKHLQYPKSAKDAGISGKCFVKFIIEVDGSLSNISILKGVPNCSECDTEALKLLGSMPKWNAGKQNGNNVRVFYNLPINFQLNSK